MMRCPVVSDDDQFPEPHDPMQDLIDDAKARSYKRGYLTGILTGFLIGLVVIGFGSGVLILHLLSGY